MVDHGNALILWSVLLCLTLHLTGKYFGLENPSRSDMRLLTHVLQLAALPGVWFVNLCVCGIWSGVPEADDSPAQHAHKRRRSIKSLTIAVS